MAAAPAAERGDYRFDPEDEAWLPFLKEEGYAVIVGAVELADVERAKTLLWEDIERKWKGAQRGDSSTWKNFYFNSPGIVPQLAQSAGAWWIRGMPGVQAAFAKIWGTADLITSMDSVICWKPWWDGHGHRAPRTEGLHLDQNPFTKPAFDCVQGMVPLVEVTARVGGLQVVPASHTAGAKAAWKARNPLLARVGDWCPLEHDDPAYDNVRFLEAQAGDLILWDSRTVHGGVVGEGLAKPHCDAGDAAADARPGAAAGNGKDELARLACTVAMVPRSRASVRVLELRVKGFQAGIPFNHAPHEAGTSSGTFRINVPRDYVPPELSPSQRAVL